MKTLAKIVLGFIVFGVLSFILGGDLILLASVFLIVLLLTAEKH